VVAEPRQLREASQMVEVAKNNGEQAAWRDSQTFKPTPNQPYPPPGWGQQRG
jgi:hypothetical protein